MRNNSFPCLTFVLTENSHEGYVCSTLTGFGKMFGAPFQISDDYILFAGNRLKIFVEHSVAHHFCDNV